MDGLESEVVCPIYIDMDTSFLGSVNSIKKNLEENSLSKKTKAMQEILLMHLKGEDVSFLLMDIIRFIVPSNDHRLKRLVYLFFQTFDMCKKDGTPRDEVILVCNALRNDLCSPNEFVRGSVLRLLSRLTIFSVIQPLIPSIIQNIDHKEPYVYRNALLCLTNIAEQFGSDLVTPSFKNIENFITSTDDVFGTVRAYKLLESCNLELCIQFILAIERNLLNLSPMIHLAILVSFEKLSSINEEVNRMMVRILMLLMQFSNNNSVLFYCSHLLLKYQHLHGLDNMNVCCKCLIKVLLNESDLNVKIIVLDKLKTISRNLALSSVLEGYVNDLFKAISMTNLVVNFKILSLILRVTTRSNLDLILSNLVKLFLKVDRSYSPEEVNAYRLLVLRAITELSSSYSKELVPWLEQLVPNLVSDDLSHSSGSSTSSSSDRVVALELTKLVYTTSANCLPLATTNTTTSSTSTTDKGSSVGKIMASLINMLESIQDKGVLCNCLYILGEFSDDPRVVSVLYQSLYSATGTSTMGGERTYNVILEDGSYSSTTVGSSGRGVGGKTLAHILETNKDILLYNTLASTVVKIVYKALTSTTTTNSSSSSSGGVVNFVEHSVLIIIKLVNSLEKGTNDLKRLNILLLLLLGLLEDRGKYLGLIGEYLRLGGRGGPAGLPESKTVDFDIDIPLTLLFSQTTTAATTSGGEEEGVEDEGDRELLNDLAEYTKVHQFTSLTDPIYVEGHVKLIGNKLYFYLLVENKTSEVLQNISLDLSTGSNLQLVTPKKSMKLSPKSSCWVKIKFRVLKSNDETVYGYIYYSFSNTILLQCLTFNPVHISLYDYIKRRRIGIGKFRSYWEEFEWEHKLSLAMIKVKPKELVESIKRYTNMTVVGGNSKMGALLGEDLEVEEGGDTLLAQPNQELVAGGEEVALMNDSFLSINLYMKNIFEQEAIANLSLVKKNDAYSGCFRIRSRHQGMAIGLSDRIKMVLREVAV